MAPGWMMTSPAPSLRELSSECETEGVSSVEWWNVKISEFRRGDENRPKPHGFASTPMNGKTHPPHKTRKNHPPADETSSGRVIDVMGDVAPAPTRRNHRTTLPQLRCAQQLPQRGSRDWCVPFTRLLAKIQRFGRFSSPLRNSDDFGFYHSTDDTPSVTPVGRDSSLREGAGDGGAVPFNVPPGNREGAGDFHRPYEGRVPLIGGQGPGVRCRFGGRRLRRC